MKRIISVFSILAVSTFIVALGAQARDNNTHMNAAYWKGGDKFDVVVKQTPNLKMKLYVNDKDPVETTVNSEGWATFSKVRLSGSGKISFTWVDDSHNEYPIDYTSKFNVTDPKASFSEDTPVEVVSQPTTTSAPAPVATPTPKAVTPAPAPAPTPSVYYKNCTAARAAGAAPVYRGEPGYASHLDRDGDGVGCE
jgi:hypothetical protein